MPSVPTPLRLAEAAPDLVRRLGLILAGLASVVARRFLREPKLVGLIVLLYGRLSRAARRFERAVTRQVAVRPARGERKSAPGVPGLRLPSGRGWLVRALGWEAAGYGCQLEALLAEPDMQAMLEAVPAAARILRPLCRMLGLVPVAAAAAKSQAQTVEMPRRRADLRPAKQAETTRPGVDPIGPSLVIDD